MEKSVKASEVLGEMESVVLVLEELSVALQVLACGCQPAIMRASCARVTHTANTLGTRKPWVLGGDRDMERWYLS